MFESELISVKIVGRSCKKWKDSVTVEQAEIV